MPLLGHLDPPPVRITRDGSASKFLLVADHAGRAIPSVLGDLGVAPVDRERHIAVDLGILELAHALAASLDATLIESAYSRLVIDCNRPPGHPTSIAPVSDGTLVPGNASLDPDAVRAREAELLAPYHAAIAARLDARAARAQPTVLVSLHSFTPRLAAGDRSARPWHAGVLHDGRSAFARAVLAQLRLLPGLAIGDNEPYRLTAQSDHTVPMHAWARGLEHVELEVRQDELADAAGQRSWADRLARVLLEAATVLPGDRARGAAT